MQKIQRQVMNCLLDGCPDCGSEVKAIGNGGYRKPACTGTDCRWFLSVEDAIQMVRDSPDYSLK